MDTAFGLHKTLALLVLSVLFYNMRGPGQIYVSDIISGKAMHSARIEAFFYLTMLFRVYYAIVPALNMSTFSISCCEYDFLLWLVRFRED